MPVRKSSYTPKDGKPGWVCDYKDAAGKRHQEAFSTKKAADARFSEVQAQIQQGKHVANSATVTVQAAYELFIAAIEADGAAPSTVKGHTLYYKNHVAPFLADKRLTMIAPATVQGYLDDLRESGRSDDTINRAKQTLGTIIDEAVRTGRAAFNPVRSLKSRRRVRRKDIEDRTARSSAVIPERSDVKLLIEGADPGRVWKTGGGPVSAAKWLQPWMACIAFAGLRPGEARGLTWAAVNFDAGFIDVRTAADGFGNLGPVKTAAAVRRVPIGDILAGMLRDWHERWVWNAHDLVFATKGEQTAEGKPPLISLSNALRLQFNPLQKRLGLVDDAGDPRYTPHKLRHFAVSLWIDEGADIKQISQWVGHESVAFTMDVYGHLFRARALDRTAATAGEISVMQAALPGPEENEDSEDS